MSRHEWEDRWGRRTSLKVVEVILHSTYLSVSHLATVSKIDMLQTTNFKSKYNNNSNILFHFPRHGYSFKSAILSNRFPAQILRSAFVHTIVRVGYSPSLLLL